MTIPPNAHLDIFVFKFIWLMVIYVQISESVGVIQSKKYRANLSVYLLMYQVSLRLCIHNSISFLKIGSFCVLITRQIGANTSVSPVNYWMIIQGEHC